MEKNGVLSSAQPAPCSSEWLWELPAQLHYERTMLKCVGILERVHAPQTLYCIGLEDNSDFLYVKNHKGQDTAISYSVIVSPCACAFTC